MSLCEINQRELMRLFQENVKTDISHTNDIIDLIQKKLQDFDLNLDSLKTSTTELNADFAVIEKKITSLDTSFKRVNSYSSSLSRSESCSSIASSGSAFSDYLTESSSNTASELSESDSDNELESTFVIVTKDEKTNNILMEDQEPCLTSCYDVSEVDDSMVVHTTIEELRKKEYRLIDRNCNQLIELLMKNASK